jgi:aminoglycoside phosphotransferase (APT) family kinase protein
MNISELRKIAEGREAEIFEWEDGTVLRLMRDSYGMESVEQQARALKAAHDAGVAVPTPGGLTIIDGRHGLIMERLDGVDLLTLIERQPWQIWSAGITTGGLQAEMHEVVAPEGLPIMKDGIKRSIESSDRVPSELVKLALDILADLPDGDRLCHGDFHPGNIMKVADRHVIIDWSNVSKGEPAADYARSQLMLHLGEPPPGTPAWVRKLAGIGSRILLSAYRRGYRAHSAVDEELVRRWEAPVMAHRLTEGIEEERPKLLKLVEERLREPN